MTGTMAARSLCIVWLLLLILLALTAGSAWFDLGWGNVALNIGIAVVKCGLVGWYYMGLRHDDGSMRLAAGLSLGLLALFAALGFADVATR